ncbi:hypothetical protein, variant [Fonticula alba]|nr:hypothetical protein, variant [Fonticula alba]KCV71880.1 hypothetical protein, variant [Fonticula alba]|eukprot:XP_009493457.1 hypothetical protein, variant [Fonticula alba]
MYVSEDSAYDAGVARRLTVRRAADLAQRFGLDAPTLEQHMLEASSLTGRRERLPLLEAPKDPEREGSLGSAIMFQPRALPPPEQLSATAPGVPVIHHDNVRFARPLPPAQPSGAGKSGAGKSEPSPSSSSSPSVVLPLQGADPFSEPPSGAALRFDPSGKQLGVATVGQVNGHALIERTPRLSPSRHFEPIMTWGVVASTPLALSEDTTGAGGPGDMWDAGAAATRDQSYVHRLPEADPMDRVARELWRKMRASSSSSSGGGGSTAGSGAGSRTPVHLTPTSLRTPSTPLHLMSPAARALQRQAQRSGFTPLSTPSGRSGYRPASFSPSPVAGGSAAPAAHVSRRSLSQAFRTPIARPPGPSRGSRPATTRAPTHPPPPEQ